MTSDHRRLDWNEPTALPEARAAKPPHYQRAGCNQFLDTGVHLGLALVDKGEHLGKLCPGAASSVL
jgi:hypothetical protein